METKTARVRALNDALRQNLTGGRAVITPGVAALGEAALARIIKTIAVFDDFCQANDPYGEHDFGAFEAEGHTIFFKVDYFQLRPFLSLARPRRPRCNRARAYDHARRRVSATAVALFRQSSRFCWNSAPHSWSE